MYEDSNNEYKREYTADIKKKVIAFANSGGGVIYVGRDDRGNPYPLLFSIRNLDYFLTSL